MAPAVSAQFQIPDPKQMSGIPRPVTDLPDGAVSVRLIRGDLSHNVTNHVVELHVGSNVLRAKTDESGRAQFDGLTPGATLKAVVDIDGEHLESEQFRAPAQGGVRLMLVATDTSKGAQTEPNAAPVAGQVAIGGKSRIVLEPRDEAVEIFYVLDIVNSARVPVFPTALFVFDMPTGAVGCSLLQGATPLANVNGTRVRVQGPFRPGSTSVQVACQLPALAGALDITQRFPATMEQVAVIVKKIGAMKLTSPQIANQQDMAVQGETYIAASGPVVAAGQPISLSLAALPHHSPAPRWIALSLAVAIVLVGVWLSMRTPRDTVARAAARERLLARRDRLFNDLVRLEHDHHNGRTDERRYAARREELIAALEHVYGALEDDGTGPEPLDRTGLAA